VNSKRGENEPDWIQNGSAIEALARDLHVPVEEIKEPYEMVLKELNENAKVKVYLYLLVGRKVREIIKENPVSGG